MSILAQQLKNPKIKPKWWGSLGTVESIVAFNCRKHGFPRPVLAMPFWEGAGNKAYDVSGRRHDGLFVNQPFWSGNGVRGDGIDDYINLGNNPDFTFGNTTTDKPFSMVAVVKMSDATLCRITSNTSDSSAIIAEWMFGLTLNDYLIITCYDLTITNNIKSISDNAYTTDEGKIICYGASYDGSGGQNGLDVFRNGIKVSQTKSSGGTYVAMHNTAGNARIGALLPTNATYKTFLNGIVYVYYLFNIQLTNSQMKFISDNPYFMFHIPEELWGYAAAVTGQTILDYERASMRGCHRGIMLGVG